MSGPTHWQAAEELKSRAVHAGREGAQQWQELVNRAAAAVSEGDGPSGFQGAARQQVGVLYHLANRDFEKGHHIVGRDIAVSYRT